jgi:DNA-binding MltR family transcriptional regulator
MDYFEVLLAEFGKESDRAAVILAASVADELLRTLLSAHLVPVTSSTDELFDGANAPLGTFSSRIEMSYRLGLVSVKFARDLHLIRKIRNDFAHNIHGCSFDDARIKSRILELSKSHGIINRSPHRFLGEVLPRQAFLETASWMIYHLTTMGKNTPALSAAAEEWGYSFIYSQEPPAVVDQKADPPLNTDAPPISGASVS